MKDKVATFIKITRTTICDHKVVDVGQVVITDAAQAALLIGMGKAVAFTGQMEAVEETVSIETAETVLESPVGADLPAGGPIETAMMKPVIETTAAPRQRVRAPKAKKG